MITKEDVQNKRAILLFASKFAVFSLGYIK